jgi:putative sigma-54 modulation protein
MRISVVFKNLDSSNHIKSYLEEKLSRLDKLVDQPAAAHAMIRAEKLRRIVEVRLAVGRIDIQASAENTELHAAIDLVMDKVKKQLNKYREKQNERRTRASSREPQAMELAAGGAGDLYIN